MTTHTKALKLETSYEKTGNSTEEQVNTLSIALGYGDINDIEDNNYEWLASAEQYALNEWLGDESNFDATLSKEEALKYSEDLKAYEEARDTWRDGIKEQAMLRDLPDNHPLSLVMQNARDEAYKDMRSEWLYGDRSSRGVIGEARKRYCDGDMEIEYDDKSGELSVTFSDDDIKNAYDNGSIDEKSEKEFVYWLECAINNDAQNEYHKKVARQKERREAHEKTREYREAVKKREEESKREKLRKLAE